MKKRVVYDQMYLHRIAKNVRKEVLLMSYSAQSAHTGGALSCVEILVALYFQVMKVFPKDPEHPMRDRLIFSKAHDAKALYAVLAERGYFNRVILTGYEADDGLLPGHSTRHCVPGVEISAGALGHGLSIAAGIALAGKLEKKDWKVYAVLSDGECNEGSTWEAVLFAGHHDLDNLVGIVDYNRLQGFGFTKDVLDLEPFADKWRAFGWNVKEVDGHNFSRLISELSSMPIYKGRPSVLIAKTIKGFGGVPSHINRVSSQYKPPTREEFAIAIAKLEEV